jgi:hypothetical protein
MLELDNNSKIVSYIVQDKILKIILQDFYELDMETKVNNNIRLCLVYQ